VKGILTCLRDEASPKPPAFFGAKAATPGYEARPKRATATGLKDTIVVRLTLCTQLDVFSSCSGRQSGRMYSTNQIQIFNENL
jgi:hypothetical protein